MCSNTLMLPCLRTCIKLGWVCVPWWEACVFFAFCPAKVCWDSLLSCHQLDNIQVSDIPCQCTCSMLSSVPNHSNIQSFLKNGRTRPSDQQRSVGCLRQLSQKTKLHWMSNWLSRVGTISIIQTLVSVSSNILKQWAHQPNWACSMPSSSSLNKTLQEKVPAYLLAPGS